MLVGAGFWSPATAAGYISLHDWRMRGDTANPNIRFELKSNSLPKFAVYDIPRRGAIVDLVEGHANVENGILTCAPENLSEGSLHVVVLKSDATILSADEAGEILRRCRGGNVGAGYSTADTRWAYGIRQLNEAVTELRHGLYPEAERSLSAMRPDHPYLNRWRNALLGLASIQEVQTTGEGGFDTAIRYLEAGPTAVPAIEDVLAKLYYGTGRFEDAIRRWETIANVSADAWTWYWLGKAYWSAGKKDEAANAWDKAKILSKVMPEGIEMRMIQDRIQATEARAD